MLDAETKRRIDTARDLLVGKVPDPKSQVEQITIALIYKFMDDMDREAVEFGGEREFFAGEFGRYSWERLKATQGGKDKLDLYMAGIASMAENPGIPSLFRDIFKNAFLPYRDPETLREFLKVIDEFSYDHSENLGNAFEYLLSVLGSQGDAGQFRTPRHIIEFIVGILQPQKREKILDPACGTAGFLISAYKYILAQNQDSQGNSTLTPDDKAYLAQNLWGYDISPDMVRLSLVNLYLHGFRSPQIWEYDTLTSEERWTEFADVILANPPFMSPTGGIKPHKRFSVQSKRSEVLFVDYILEHLTPQGRAGIIVPEGVIFQSQKAYKQLRQLLVERFLVAVISLPAGVFQPYSGVKTSILIVDRALAIRSGFVGFFKVENDGFGLGAQRRSIEANDLPAVGRELGLFLARLRAGEGLEGFEPQMGLIVSRERIGENGEFNLSGERYRTSQQIFSGWPVVKVGDICTTSSGGTPLKGNAHFYEGGCIPWLRSGEVAQGEIFRSELFITEEGLQNSSAKVFPINTVLVAMYGATAGEVGILRFESSTNQAVCGIIAGERVLADYLFHILKSNKPHLIRLAGGGAQPNISQKIIRDFEIPLPPIEVQREIVAEIEGYQKVIDGARAVVENYRPQIAIDPEWPIVKLGDLCSFKNGLNFEKGGSKLKIKMINVGDFQSHLYAPISTVKEVELDNPVSDDYLLQEGDILFVRSNGNKELVGRSILIPENQDKITFSGFTIRARVENTGITPIFLAYLLKSRVLAERIKTVGQGANIRNLSQGILTELEVPLPPLETQKAIVAEIEAEQQLVNANRELIHRFQQKIQTTLDRIWGQPPTP